MDPDLIKVTEIFLVPSSFLVAALGAANTNPHRAGISLLGLLVSVLWLICSREAVSEHEAARPEATGQARPRRTHIMANLAVIFVIGWVGSLVIHVAIWNQPM